MDDSDDSPPGFTTSDDAEVARPEDLSALGFAVCSSSDSSIDDFDLHYLTEADVEGLFHVGASALLP